MESATGIRSAVGWRKVGDVVELMEAAVLLGNGGQRDGMAIIAALARRMEEARKKHPVFAEGKYHALGVIGAEYEELVRAVERETPERVRDEALDVAVTALRLWAGEEICL
jgi:UTP:GlnB (protein PII) uridylyltransferase